MSCHAISGYVALPRHWNTLQNRDRLRAHVHVHIYIYVDIRVQICLYLNDICSKKMSG